MSRRRVESVRSHTVDVAESWARERPDLDPSDYLFLIYAARLGRVLERLDDRNCLRDFGISAADMRVLYALRRAGPPFARRPTELFRALLVTSGAITKQVERLAALKLVERKFASEGGGTFVVQLTDAGRAMADRALTALANRSVTSPARSSLTAEERRTLIELCRKVLVDIEREMNTDERGP